jgi:nitrilase
MTSTVRAAVVQAAPVPFDGAATVPIVRSTVAEAAGSGAQLVVLPEAFVGGYPKGVDFGTKVGVREPGGRELFARYWCGAIDVPGPVCDELGAVAAEFGVHLVIGVIERAGSTLYCAVLTFAPDGSLLMRRRKLMPTAAERLVWGFGDGSTIGVVDTPIGRIGSVICWENYMPLLRVAMYAQGIELYCAPTVDDRDTWFPTMRHIATEGRCFVLSAVQFCRRGDYPDDYHPVQGDDPDTIMIRGGSCIVGPLGQVLAGPAFDAPAVLLADLDLAALPAARYDLDVVGHYARPDIFSLHVNTVPQSPVSFTTGPGG